MSDAQRKRGTLRTVARAAGTLLIAAFALLTVIRVSGWQADVYPLPSLLAFTPYGVAAGVVLLAGSLLGRRWVHALAAAASTLALLAIVDPRTRPTGTAAEPRDEAPAQIYGTQKYAGTNAGARGPVLRITTLNTKWGGADLAQLTRLAQRERTDIVALQEIDAAGWARLRRSGLLRRYPHVVGGAGQRYDDGVVVSRWPARELDLGLPSVYRAARVSVPGAAPVAVVTAHPAPPVRPNAQRDWVAWLAALPGPARLAGGRVIVAGDFNATVDHAQFRGILDRGWDDAALRAGAGLRPTWHGLPMLRLTIDHILIPPSFGVRDYRVDQIKGTDHRAVTATIRLPR